MKFSEKIPRSLAKVISWRILVTITNFIGGWLVSGNRADWAKEITDKVEVDSSVKTA